MPPAQSLFGSVSASLYQRQIFIAPNLIFRLSYLWSLSPRLNTWWRSFHHALIMHLRDLSHYITSLVFYLMLNWMGLVGRGLFETGALLYPRNIFPFYLIYLLLDWKASNRFVNICEATVHLMIISPSPLESPCAITLPEPNSYSYYDHLFSSN